MQCHFYSLKICRRDWPNWALHASPSSQLVPHAFSSERHDLNIWITTKHLGIPPFSIFFPSSLVVPQAFGWGPSMENIGQVLWNSCLPPTTTNHKKPTAQICSCLLGFHRWFRNVQKYIKPSLSIFWCLYHAWSSCLRQVTGMTRDH